MSKSANLYFIRHGDPDYDHDALTELGKYQAEKTSEYLAKIPFDIIFSSPLGRAAMTANYLAKRINKDINYLPWISEHNASIYAARFDGGKFVNWYFWEKDTIELFHKLQNDNEWYLSKELPPSVYQGTKVISEEINRWLKTIGIERDEKNKEYHQIGDVPENIAVFAHGGMATLFLSNILNMTYPNYVSHFQVLATCGVVHIKINLDALQSVELVQYNGIYYD